MKKYSTFLLILISLLGHALSVNSVILALVYSITICAGTTAVSFMGSSTFKKQSLPVLFFFCLIFAVLVCLGEGLIRQLSLFLGLAQIILAFQKKTIRQYRLIICISLLHLVGMCAQTMHGLTAPLILLYCMIFPFALAEIDSRCGRFRTTLPFPHRLGQVMLLFSMIILLFLTLPRTSNEGESSTSEQRGRENNSDYQHQPRQVHAINFRSPGYSDRVDLNYNGPTKITNDVVFSMRVPGPLRKQPLYLRGFSFNQYSNGEWTNTIKETTKRFNEDSYLELANRGSIPDAELFNIDFKLDTRITHDTVFTTLSPISISDFSFQLRQDGANDLKILRAQQHQLYYSLKVCRERIPLTRKAVIQSLDKYLVVEPRLQYIRKFAWNIVGDTNLSKHERASKLRKHLTTKYSYSHILKIDTPDHLAHLDPIERFLFHDYRGHCEKFATAYVLLCRSVGVPSRIVTGFVYYPFDDNGKEWIDVRQTQSHAWAEIYLPATGWIAVEATASHIANRTAPETTPQDMMVQASNLWTTHVLHFNKSMQINLGLNFGFFSLAFNAGGAAGLILMILLASSFPFVLVLIPLIFGIYKFRQLKVTKLVLAKKWSDPAKSDFPGMECEVPFYKQLLNHLNKKGVVRKTSETGMELSIRLAGIMNHEKFDILTAYYYSVRYGNRILSISEHEEIQLLLKEISAD